MFDFLDLNSNEFFLPLLIFTLKTFEICINSIRVITVSKSYKNISVLLSIFECIIWISALSTVFTNLGNVFNILFYALGMACGNYLGITIENKLALGDVMIRIITQKDATKLLQYLRKVGFRVTEVPATSNHGKVSILFSPIKRNHQKKFINIIKKFNPLAFFTIEDIKITSTKIGKDIKFKLQ